MTGKQIQKMYRKIQWQRRIKFFFFLLAWLMLLFLCAVKANSASLLSFSWVPNTDTVTTGYWLYMDGTEKIASIEDKTVGIYSYMLEDDAISHTFLLIAHSADGQYSMPSATAKYVPVLPTQPQKFLITLEKLP